MTDQPWLSEPNTLDGVHALSGYRWHIHRCNPSEMGHLCGYVEVQPEHPFYCMGYGEERILTNSVPLSMVPPRYLDRDSQWISPDAILSVHCGITFAEHPYWIPEEYREARWAFGFDCAHAGDLVPAMHHRLSLYGSHNEDIYRDIGYVQQECQNLAGQLYLLRNVTIGAMQPLQPKE